MVMCNGGFRVTYLGSADIGEPMEATATDRADQSKNYLRVRAKSPGFYGADSRPRGISATP
jgi:hypothetical protein